MFTWCVLVTVKWRHWLNGRETIQTGHFDALVYQTSVDDDCSDGPLGYVSNVHKYSKRTRNVQMGHLNAFRCASLVSVTKDQPVIERVWHSKSGKFSFRHVGQEIRRFDFIASRFDGSNLSTRLVKMLLMNALSAGCASRWWTSHHTWSVSTRRNTSTSRSGLRMAVDAQVRTAPRWHNFRKLFSTARKHCTT